MDDQYRERLEFAHRTVDFLARSDHNQKTTATLNVPPEALPTLRLTGVRWISTLDLPPGHYSLRVAGHGIETGRTGSVFLDIDVPNFTSQRLWIEGLAVTSKPAALAVTTGPSPAVFNLPTPPTTARTFVRGDLLTLSADVNTPQDFTTGAVRLTVRAAAALADAPPLLDRTTDLTSREVAHQPRAWVVDTSALPAGQFVLRLTLRDARGREAETAIVLEIAERGREN